VKLSVNGVEQSIVSPPLTSLLAVLREELEVTSPKAGCQQGGCGACAVLVDGSPMRSCLIAVATVEGAEITTVEGLGSPEALSPVQEAFHRHYAAQCGFCTPGMVVAASALIAAKGGPLEREEVLDGLSGHYCRCTGYVKIVAAVMAASRGEQEPAGQTPQAQLQGSPA
jgi:aerobic-type carbon monoxide dehydrogenase small subunit (CoxS/CutS family)